MISPVPYVTDEGFARYGRIGLVVLSNDQTLPLEARRMLDIDGIALYESRLLSVRRRHESITIEGLSQLADRIQGAVGQLNTMRDCKVVALGCTSGAMVIGAEQLEEKVRSVIPGAMVTDPFQALLAALHEWSASRIAFVSPYSQEVAEMMTDSLELNGVQVVSGSVFSNSGAEVGADAPFISPASIEAAVLQAGSHPDSQAVVVACTQLRAAALAARLESTLRKPVLTSNLALCWHALRLCGYQEPVTGWGELFLRRTNTGEINDH